MSESTMTWDLETIFSGGSSSPDYREFRSQVRAALEQAQETLDALPKRLDAQTEDHWREFLHRLEEVAARISQAESFAHCLAAQDVTDEAALGIIEEMSSMNARLQAIMTGVEELATTAGDTEWDRLVSREPLAGSRFFWDELRRNARDKMEPKMERLTAELAVNGYHGWNRLYSKIAGDLRAEFTEDGETKSLSMGQLANRFNSPKRDIRRQAFEKLEESWRSVDALAAMALNSQAGFRLDVYKNRGWESPLHEPLVMGRLKRETVEAMWRAVAGGARKMSEYVAAKKRLLGLDEFRWYDQAAPAAGTEKSFSYEEACNFVAEHLSSFSKDLGSFARKAIDNRWIEAEDRSGKAAGGFCTGFPVSKESRIFMTFSGAYDELMTIAHELGHAYHSYVLKDLNYFARHYPMNLAETASTFNELLVTDAALNAAGDEETRLSLLDKKLQEGFVMFCNIRARFLFDSRFYEERKQGSVPKERLNEIMVEAQKEAFAGTLAENGYHPLFWASKLHFFETEMPFYNFPYTFGYLFAGGIYDLARKEGPEFAESYRALLADTGSMTTEELAEKHLDIDLTGDRFWSAAVERVVADLEPFGKLAASR
ncbi:MAG: M3 family oligoendopeptidase [Candidatus Eisenbacteria bacterium]|nr:M3 family oligoendopeptidase [Candidatus Eisenbacteria bacterium]